ncbi:PREDICTED: conserved (UCP030365) [Prunus dulcis]|uniref:PREDICTED: conserved (UCP030365) n=1 Tax=Prunus dulcis TaxID=3755 RepID=A0A5E4ES46_PRUDU|nr:uncharacterized protein LOC117620345 [Prunus dulcis]KAI5346710.1 hypothetical protein L3X38_014589 [Prunus dulcis]VVA18535.1 PREDICTED: conserved (UCP030365) [Prunus dulcis]
MEDRCDSGKGLVSIPRSDSKIVGEKRVSTELGQERDLGSRKRLKMRDLESVCRSEGINPHHTKSLKNKESSGQFQSSGEEMSQVTEVPITLDLDASQAGKAWSKALSVAVNPASRPLDLNTDMCLANNTVQDDSQQCPESSGKITLLRDPSKCVNEKGIRLDLNAEDASIPENQDPFYPYKNTNHLKPRAVSECGSCTGPLEEKDSMRVWKEMKQNGFLSSTHGGIPMPKQRTKKSKNEELKKKMERAKREQVDRFAKIAAPSGLLNELNPGIINHVRNRKQVRSIIESLVKFEKLENDRVGNMLTTHPKSGACEIGNRKDLQNMNESGVHFCHGSRHQNTSFEGGQTRGFPISMNRSFIPQDKGRDGERTTVDRFSGRRFMSHSVLENEEDTLALKLPSSTNASEDDSPLSNEETASYLSIKAATIASQWLGLILQDIKGRLAALRRSRKRVRDVITTDLPSLLSKEFPSDQENDPCITKNSTGGFPSCTIADMHRARWNPLFEQMDKALSEEEDQLESWSNQVKEMQLHCDQGLQIVQWNTASGSQQLGTSENDPRSHILDNSDRALAVRAAAASIYSTCNFLLSTNVPCF